jgi:hypothetical protein
MCYKIKPKTGCAHHNRAPPNWSWCGGCRRDIWCGGTGIGRILHAKTGCIFLLLSHSGGGVQTEIFTRPHQLLFIMLGISIQVCWSGKIMEIAYVANPRIFWKF